MKSWNGEMLLPRTLSLTSPSIHQAIYLSHSSLLLFHISISLSLVGLCLKVPSVSTIQRSDREDEALGRDIKSGMLALVPISPWIAGPSICLHMIWSWLSPERKKGLPPMTNDNLRINTRGEGGEEKKSWITLSSSISHCSSSSPPGSALTSSGDCHSFFKSCKNAFCRFVQLYYWGGLNTYQESSLSFLSNKSNVWIR